MAQQGLELPLRTTQHELEPQNALNTMKTSNIAKYRVDQHVPRLLGRVVEIIPDTPGATNGPGLLKIKDDEFELRLSIRTPGLVDKPCSFTVVVASRTVEALKQAIIKKMKLSKAIVDQIKLTRRPGGADKWVDVDDLNDLQMNGQNILRIHDNEGCRNIYKKWHATIDKTPSLDWTLDENADLDERLGATYTGTRYFQKPAWDVVRNRYCATCINGSVLHVYCGTCINGSVLHVYRATCINGSVVHALSQCFVGKLSPSASQRTTNNGTS
jgi:hypothetical protein